MLMTWEDGLYCHNQGGPSLKIHSLPFLKERASDEMTYTLAVIELLRTLGAEMNVGTEPLKGAVARSVATFYTNQPEPVDIEGKLVGPKNASRLHMFAGSCELFFYLQGSR